MNILMLGGAKRVAMAGMLKEAGTRLGHEVKIFSYELTGRLPIAAAGTIITGLRWHDPGIYAHLNETVRRYSIDIMLPFVDPAIPIVRNYLDSYGDVFAPVSYADTIEMTLDKLSTQTFFTGYGIAMPKMHTLGKRRPEFPLIAKPRRGSASNGIRIIDTPQLFREIIHDADSYVVQSYIANREEFTVDAYVSVTGRIMCAVPRKRLEVLGGEVMRTITVDEPEITAISNKALSLSGFRGPVTLQFLRDLDNGNLMLMEINPRFGGGAVCAVHAGAPLPEYVIRECLGLPVTPVSNWTVGTEIVRYPAEVVFKP